MIVDCISDLHHCFPKLQGGDLLIIAGDMTGSNSVIQWNEFFKWMEKQKYKKIVYIGGNHDNFLSNCCSSKEARDLNLGEEIREDIDYLWDTGIEYQDFKIWGSPWTPLFKGIHPNCKAFMLPDDELAEKWALIPEDTNILITHGPPFAMLDKTIYGVHAGSKTLADRILNLIDLDLHVFGHIHEGYGQSYQTYYGESPWDTLPTPMGHLSINASLVNFQYKPVNKPVRLILK